MRVGKPNYQDYDEMGSFLRDTRIYLKSIHGSKYTQKAVAEYCGLSSVQFISNIERSLCTPSYDIARKLQLYYTLPRRAFYELFLKRKEQVLREEFLAKTIKER